MHTSTIAPLLGRRIFFTVSDLPLDKIHLTEPDFLVGFGTAFIEKSSLLLRGCGGGITAWKGTITPYANKFGVYISDSSTAAANSTIAPELVGQCALGRPWNALMRSVFMNTYLDSSIKPQGFIVWSTTASQYNASTIEAEWKDYGPGYNLTAILASNVTQLLTDDMVEQYRTPESVFMTPTGKQPAVDWIDEAYLGEI